MSDSLGEIVAFVCSSSRFNFWLAHRHCHASIYS
jgi:hypothetical protein